MTFRIFMTYLGSEGPFETFGLRFAEPEYFPLLDYLTDITGDDISALNWLAIKAIIPDTIEIGEEFPLNSDTSQVWECENTLHFVAARDQSFLKEFYPEEPAEAATISTTLASNPTLYYAYEQPYEGMDVPDEIDPDTYPPDENYAYLGDEWGWALPVVAYSTSYYNWAWIELNWRFLWDGCELPAIHILNFLDDLVYKANGAWWYLSSARRLDGLCHITDEDYPTHIWEVAGNTTTVSVWVWQPDADYPIIIYSPNLFTPPEPQPRLNPILPLTALSVAIPMLFSRFFSNFRFFRNIRLYGEYQVNRILVNETDRPIINEADFIEVN